jgi:hypothetical protein
MMHELSSCGCLSLQVPELLSILGRSQELVIVFLWLEPQKVFDDWTNHKTTMCALLNKCFGGLIDSQSCSTTRTCVCVCVCIPLRLLRWV